MPRPAIPITKDPLIIRYKGSPNVRIAYPVFDDFVGLYDPSGEKGPDWAHDTYLEFSHRHRVSVQKQLDTISSGPIGKAVLAEIGASPANFVNILPHDFLPQHYWGGRILADTIARSVVLELDRGAKFCADVPNHGRVCGYGLGPGGGGSNVDIFYSSLRTNEVQGADEVLLHELVHASRKARGIVNYIPMNGGFGDQEEFLANLVENMYKSQSGKDLYDYGGTRIDPARFLDSKWNPSPRALLGLWRTKQPTLFTALARVKAPFNPIHQYAPSL